MSDTLLVQGTPTRQKDLLQLVTRMLAYIGGDYGR